MRRPQHHPLRCCMQKHRTDKNIHHHHEHPMGGLPDDPMGGLPDDLVIFVLSKLSSSVSSPSDFISVLLTCKRLKRLVLDRLVLSKLSARAFAVKPKNWSDSADRFFRRCITAGNVEACYTLGMIHFYCLQKRKSGLSLMAKAAMNSHAPALYSLAVIQFNGSGASKNNKDLRSGVALCTRASLLGHIDSLRELGYCLQDGYGARQNVAEGRRLLVEAHARELALVIREVTRSTSPSNSSMLTWLTRRLRNLACHSGSFLPLLEGYGGYSIAVQPVNWFMREWFESGRGRLGEGLRLCAHVGCGRPETRPHEFRRCSVCGKVNYCSRGCQALDWKLRHKTECSEVLPWVVVVENDGVGGVAAVVGGGNGDVVA